VRAAPRGGRVGGPSVRQLRGSGGGGRRSGGVRRRAKTGERAARVGCARERGRSPKEPEVLIYSNRFN
jgi:hypothetical protein